MRQLAASFLLLCALGCSGNDESDANTDRGPSELGVMTFNVLCSFCGGGDYDGWDARLGYFQDIFERHDADLLGLQEVALDSEVEQMLELAPGFGALYFQPDDAIGYPDALILYRESRFTVKEQGEYWLSPTPDEPRSTGFASPQLARLVKWAKLHDGNTGKDLFFATTHFDNNSPSQELSAPLVMERTAPWAETLPVIFTGDFNSQPDDEAYAILTSQAETRGFELVNSQTIADDWKVTTNVEPAPVYDLDQRIDHIFVAGPVSWTSPLWEVDTTVYGPDDRYPSDHRPMVARLDYR